MSKSSSLTSQPLDLIPCVVCGNDLSPNAMYMSDGEIGVCCCCSDIVKYAIRRRSKEFKNMEDSN